MSKALPIALKPCPFCGGDAELCTTAETAYCYCKKCMSTGASFIDVEHNGRYIFDALEAWNKRTKLESTQIWRGWSE